MHFKASIDIMPLKELLDPQGKTVLHNMKNLGFDSTHDVRIGKHIDLMLEAANEAAAHEQVESACKKLLANMIMESYTFTLEAV